MKRGKAASLEIDYAPAYPRPVTQGRAEVRTVVQEFVISCIRCCRPTPITFEELTEGEQSVVCMLTEY